MKECNKFLGGILLVAGTTIGAGMLALPITTGMAGFLPSLALFFLYWVYMTYTAFLILEVNLWTDKGGNLLSMAKLTLGRWGQGVSFVVYLFLLYSLTTAYMAGSASILTEVINAFFGFNAPIWMGVLSCLLIFGYFVYRGTHFVDRANRLLMCALVFTFGIMVVFLVPHVEESLLTHIDWKYILMGVSVAATSFGFHIIIPSLVTYLDHDVNQLKRVVLIGSAIPLIVYILWELLALGVMPIQGKNGILEGYFNGGNGAQQLANYLKASSIAFVARFFSFFAIITSFLGVSLSLLDFLADGFKIKKTKSGRVLLCLLTFIPPLVITLINPGAFLIALEYAGAFGVVILLGLLPALMVWFGRYSKGLSPVHAFRAWGGKGTLLVVILVSLSVMGLELAIRFNLLPWLNLR